MTFDAARYEQILPDVIADFVASELRARKPTKFAEVSALDVKASSNWRDDFALDSLDRMAVSAAAAEFFNVYDSGREDTLLGVANCERWTEVVLLSQAEATRNITFRSSGSTAAAKHFRHPHAWLEQEASHWADALRESGRTRIVTHVPLHHIYGYLWVAMLSVVSGLPWTRQATQSLRTPSFDNGDVLITTPHLLESWIARGISASANDVIAISSTGRFVSSDANTAQQKLGFTSVWEIYGSSETAGLGVRKSGEASYAWLPYIAQSNGANRDEVHLTRAIEDKFVSLPLPDHIERTDDGRFIVGPRNDDIVKIAGERIDLTTAREILRGIVGVADANIRTFQDGEFTALKAFVVPKDLSVDEPAFIDHLKQALRGTWSQAIHVSQWNVGTQVPKNDMGKLTDW